MFHTVKRVPASALGLLLLSQALLSCWINLYAFPRDLFAPVARLSGGWVQPTLVAALVAFACAAPLLLAAGRMRLADMGWRGADLRVGAALLLALFALLQLQALAGGAPAALAPAWSERGAARVLGALIAQLLGTALLEETLFRGVLLPQTYMRLAGRMRPAWALAAAVLVSQGLFALAHLPNRAMLGVEGGALLQDLGMLFFVGLLFSLVYLATGNLFVPVALHALFNAPVLLVPGSDAAARSALLVCTLLLVVPWRSLARLGRAAPSGAAVARA